MESRFLLAIRGCGHCLQAKKAVNSVNCLLPVDKRIRIIDCTSYQEFGLNNIPILKVFSKMGLEEGYPFLYIDGAVVEPAPNSYFLKKYLLSFFEQELIIERR